MACSICKKKGHTKNKCSNPNYGKRFFKGISKHSLQEVLEKHDLGQDFLSSQDLKINLFLQKAPMFTLAGSVDLELKVSWNPDFDKSIRDVLYVIVVDGWIIKYGMTETSLVERHQSLLTGKEEYSQKNSVTNRRARPLLEKAVAAGKVVEYYATPLPSVPINYISIDGFSVTSFVSPTREEEKRLYEMIVELTNGVQPLLNAQVPGGKKK